MKVAAVDIGGTAVKTGVVDEKGELLVKQEYPTRAHEGGELLMNRLIQVIDQYGKVDGIGISSAGAIDHQRGEVVYATENLPGWTGMKIKERLEAVFGLPVAVENDVNAAALGEAYYGAGREETDFICLTYGTGIGGAIIAGRALYRGVYGSAGEFGHMITHAYGRVCNCGARGCYEAYASAAALVRRAEETTGRTGIEGRDIFRLREEGDQGMGQVVDEWLEDVLIGLVSVVHGMNPGCIILGGGVMMQPYVLEYLRHHLAQRILPGFRPVRLEQAGLGNDAGVMGAAHCALSLLKGGKEK